MISSPCPHGEDIFKKGDVTLAKYKKTNDVTGVGKKSALKNTSNIQKNLVTSSSKNINSTENKSASKGTSTSQKSYVGTSTYKKSSFAASSPSASSSQSSKSGTGTSYTSNRPKASVGRRNTSLSEDALKSSLSSMTYENNRKTRTNHVLTSSQAHMMAALSATRSTNYYNSTNVSVNSYVPKLNTKMGQFDYGSLKESSDRYVNTQVSLNDKQLSVFSQYAKDNGLEYSAVKNGRDSTIYVWKNDLDKLQHISNNIVSDNSMAGLNGAFNKISGTVGNLSNGVSSTLGQASRLTASEDFGTGAVGGVAAAGVVGIKTFEAAQMATQAGITVGKGTIAAADFAYKGFKTVDQFSSIMRITPLNGDAFKILRGQALANGLQQTKIAQGIIHSANGVKTLINSGVRTGNSIVNAAKITRNVFAGKYSKDQILHFAKREFKLFKLGTRINLAKGARVTFTKALPKTGKLLGKGAIKGWRFGAKALMTSNDLGLQSVGTAMEASYQAANISVKAVKATAKTLQTGGKTIVYAGKGAYRATTGVVRGAAFIKNNGLKQAWKMARVKGKGVLKAAGKNVFKALEELLKRLGTKLIVPIAIIIAIVIGINIITAPIMGIASVFSGKFSHGDTGLETDISEYLRDPSNGIPPRLDELKNDLLDKITEAEGSYDIVRLKINVEGEEGHIVKEHTLDAIGAALPTTDELVEMLAPLFNAVILMNYDNAPTEAQLQDLLDHIWDTLFVIVEEDTIEYCGQDLETGEGDPDTCGYCGAVHAHDDCPHPLPKAYHTAFTCDLCCYYTCPGHVQDDGSITYCSGCEPHCNGHIDCGGHSVHTIILTCDGIYALVQEYFQDPIDELEGISPRTDDQEEKLRKLKDYYAIFNEMAKMVGLGGYSGDYTPVDLSKVKWVDGHRVGCDAIIEYAKQFEGNVGGKIFWSDYGFTSRQAWCACFVYYVMRHSGYGGSYPPSDNYAYCPTMAAAFSAVGRFADRSFGDIVAGDVIYFDYKHQGETHHTGLVIGRDATKVYTIEGNAGDMVKIRSYNLDSSVIYGYGLMNY